MENPYKSRGYEKYGFRDDPYVSEWSGYLLTLSYQYYIYSNLLIYIGLLKGILRENLGK